MHGTMQAKSKAILIVCAIIGLTISNRDTEQNPVMLTKTTELKSGMKLRYTISLPESFSPSQTYPLVLALHYGGRVTPFYGKEFLSILVEPALKELEAIIVAPDCPSKGWANPISEACILELMVLIMEEYNIDSNRSLIVGYSMGGLGTWYMASRHSDLFSAAIPISALPDTKTTPVIKDIPLYVIHGDNDELFPVGEVKKFFEKQMIGGAAIRLMIVKGVSHYQTARFIKSLQAAIPWIREVWGE